MLFLVGLTSPMKQLICYSHLLEFMPGRESKFTGQVLFMFEMVLILSPVYFLYISNDTWIFLYIALALNVISLILSESVYIPESLKFTLSKKKFD